MNSQQPDNPDNVLAGADREHLNRLEAIVQSGLDTDREIAAALAEISDLRLYRPAHPTFEAYLRERWGTALRAPHGDQQSQALRNVWEHAQRALAKNDVTGLDVSLTIHTREPTARIETHRSPDTPQRNDSNAGAPVSQLRWLLSQSSGTIAHAVHQIETCGAELDEAACEQLRDDLLVLDEELGILKALLITPADWDADYQRLLDGEIPPLGPDTEDDADEWR